MSSNYLDSIIVPRDMVRDFLYTSPPGALGERHDVPVEFNVLGLDVFIHNRGAAALTISLNGQTPITVDAGDTYTVNGQKFWLVAVVSGVIYDLQIAGVRVTTLRRLKLLRL
jgi:hypothetical protein